MPAPWQLGLPLGGEEWPSLLVWELGDLGQVTEFLQACFSTRGKVKGWASVG